jgi:hypothetical protein
MNQRTLDSIGNRLWIDDENWEKRTEVKKVAIEDNVIETDDSDDEDSEDEGDDEDEDIDIE